MNRQQTIRRALASRPEYSITEFTDQDDLAIPGCLVRISRKHDRFGWHHNIVSIKDTLLTREAALQKWLLEELDTTYNTKTNEKWRSGK